MMGEGTRGGLGAQGRRLSEPGWEQTPAWPWRVCARRRPPPNKSPPLSRSRSSCRLSCPQHCLLPALFPALTRRQRDRMQEASASRHARAPMASRTEGADVPERRETHLRQADGLPHSPETPAHLQVVVPRGQASLGTSGKFAGRGAETRSEGLERHPVPGPAGLDSRRKKAQGSALSVSPSRNLSFP